MGSTLIAGACADGPGASWSGGERERRGARRGAARERSRRPSGRPGTRRLRIGRKPLSTERRDPSRATPCRPAGRLPAVVGGAEPGSLRRGCPSGTPSLAQRRFPPWRGRSPVGRPAVDWAEPTGLLPSAVNVRRDLRIHRPSPEHLRCPGQVAPTSRADGRGAPPDEFAGQDHSPGRTWTVRPRTTVRRQTGSAVPGVRSGRPGVPERGSVDQRATRSSGVWTTSSPVRHTA